MPRFIHIPPTGDIGVINAGDEETAYHEIKDVLGEQSTIELVSSTINPHMACLIDEDGKMKRLPRNPRATALIVGLIPGDFISGHAIFIGKHGPELSDCPATLEEFHDFLSDPRGTLNAH